MRHLATLHIATLAGDTRVQSLPIAPTIDQVIRFYPLDGTAYACRVIDVVYDRARNAYDVLAIEVRS